MSLLTEQTAFAVGIGDSIAADSILNLSTAKRFNARIETNLDPLTLPVQYIDDPREKVRLHVTDLTQAKAVTVGNLVQFSLNGALVKFEIVNGYASGAGYQSKFLAIEKTTLDQ